MEKIALGYKEIKSDDGQEKIREAINKVMGRTGKGLIKTAQEVGLTYQTLRIFVLKNKNINFDSLIKIVNYVNNHLEG